MSEPHQQFSASLAKGAVYKTGLRTREILEIYSPAVHQAVVVEAMPAAATAR